MYCCGVSTIVVILLRAVCTESMRVYDNRVIKSLFFVPCDGSEEFCISILCTDMGVVCCAPI